DPPPPPRAAGPRSGQGDPARGDPGDRGRVRRPGPAPGPARVLSAPAVLPGLSLALGRTVPYGGRDRGVRRLRPQPPAGRSGGRGRGAPGLAAAAGVGADLRRPRYAGLPHGLGTARAGRAPGPGPDL